MGVLYELASLEKLFDHWKELQDSFLATHAQQFTTAPSKAWNIYSVYITSQVADIPARSELMAIEEDFQSTRKLARAAIITRRDLDSALLPLLPIRHVPSLTAEDADEELRRRLREIEENAQLFAAETQPSEIVQRLLGDA
ncbi:MAG: hypothetical protein MI923_09810 [Phycisphaerales bacterium]|nr:hypothetical protein [Phycisphaerales bacterium]